MTFKILRYIVSVLLLINLTIDLCAQIVINEFSAANASVIADPDYNDYSDWIELHNLGDAPINIKNYALSDNFNTPQKWQIQYDLIIQAEGYVLLWADGNDINNHINFKLSSLGEELILTDPSGVIVDSLSYSYQRSDVSYARIADGDLTWGYYSQPTPGISNTGIYYKGFTENKTHFSMQGGFYSENLKVTLSTDLGGVIRYTIDGSEPTENDELYSDSISITKTTVLRARIFKSYLLPGPVVSHSYFINENSIASALPVISLISESDNFWHPEQGIYVQNFKPLWEVPINIELFENDGSNRAAFNQLAGTKINGLWSWQLPQKMLGIYFRKQYGSGNLEYPIFHQRKRNSFKSFALRASGSDWSYTLFRDVLGQHAAFNATSVDVMSFKPALVYLNGAYLGIHNMREKVNSDYIEKSYSLPAGSFDLVENENFAEAGNLQAYNDLHTLLHTNLSEQANFDAVADLMDIENFSDYVITELVTANTSINHNVMAWKPKYGGKWRWILMDLDRGFFNPSEHLYEYYIDADVLPLNNLLENADYTNYFAKRISAQLYSGFSAKAMEQLLSEHRVLIDQEMDRHIERWLGTTSSYGDALPSKEYWEYQVDRMRHFVNERPQALMANLESVGFKEPRTLYLGIYPKKAATISLNGIDVAENVDVGLYIADLDLDLEANTKVGYEFKHWLSLDKTVLIAKESTWKYWDRGHLQNEDWFDATYEDNLWKSGTGQFGYGDGDESTLLDYGDNASQKYLGSYFRKSFSITEVDSNEHTFILNLLKDDGAVVYVNGAEVLRINISDGALNEKTIAVQTVGTYGEGVFFPYNIPSQYFKAGENIIALAIYQKSAESSDLSFDAELIALSNDAQPILSTNKNIQPNMGEDLYLSAMFEETGVCVLPSQINSSMTLERECSPYYVQGDVFINNGSTLTIEAGVEIYMPRGASMEFNGNIFAKGSADEPITFRINPDFEEERWGALIFKNNNNTSFLSNVIIEDASVGKNPVTETAAISAFYANLTIDSLTLINNYGNPILGRYSNIQLSNSQLHSRVTGDLINVKYGMASITNCNFIGNDEIDTDAIDYDEINGGLIKNCTISGFYGFNSDAIDIGEACVDVVIDSVFVNRVTDKGVSVGQRSSVTISNSVFTNCQMGVAVKDSSRAIIDHCLFYGNEFALSAFEKNYGAAGGNIFVSNSILSNSFAKATFADKESQLQVSYSLSDTDSLVENSHNIWANPQFSEPTFFNFNLSSESPALNASNQNSWSEHLGVFANMQTWQSNICISKIYVDPLNDDSPEFIALLNASNSSSIDISGYSIDKGITVTIPQGISLSPGQELYLTNDDDLFFWRGVNKKVITWQEGKLSNNGESIQLRNSHGMIIDFLNYAHDGLWPENAFVKDQMMALANAAKDNHLPEYWEAQSLENLVGLHEAKLNLGFNIYPNPSTGVIHIEYNESDATSIKIIDFGGQVLMHLQPNEISYSLEHLKSGVYFIQAGDKMQKLILQP